jgi:hypothetical protein
MLLLISCAAIFSGCATTLYVPVICAIDVPKRIYDGVKCGTITDDEKFVECVILKDKDKDTDYKNLLIAFESCK